MSERRHVPGCWAAYLGAFVVGLRHDIGYWGLGLIVFCLARIGILSIPTVSFLHHNANARGWRNIARLNFDQDRHRTAIYCERFAAVNYYFAAQLLLTSFAGDALLIDWKVISLFSSHALDIARRAQRIGGSL